MTGSRRRDTRGVTVMAWAWRCVWPVLLMLCLAAPTWAQGLRVGNGELDRRKPQVDRRVTWLQWWEANRETYLTEALAREGRAGWEETPDAEQLERVVNALIKATEAPVDPQPGYSSLRASSTLSLGRIGTEAAVDRLIELLDDEQVAVQTATILGLGVSGDEKAREVLLSLSPRLQQLRLARVTALGLLEPGDAEAIEVLKRELLDLGVHAGKARALQSLRLLKAEHIAQMGYEVIHDTRSVSLASEAVLAMGADPQEAHAELMVSLLLGGPPASRLHFSDNGLSPGTAFAAAQELYKYDGMIPGGEDRLKRILTRKALNTTPSGYGDYYRGPALLSLPPLIEHGEEDIFYDALDGKTTGLLKNKHSSRYDTRTTLIRKDDPIRGYAALAMGFYLQRVTGGSAEGTPPEGYAPHEVQRVDRRFTDKLSQTLSNDKEYNDVRAAAAMALAFSKHPDGPALIVTGLEATDPDNVMVMGYGALALALTGDEQAAALAKRYFKKLKATDERRRAPLDLDGDTVLGLRAMALAMGLVGDETAAQVMVDAWDADPWVSLESATALNWLEDQTLADRMARDLLKAKTEREKMQAALGLGYLYETRRPSPFTRMLTGSNYTFDARGNALAPAEAMNQNPRISGAVGPVTAVCGVRRSLNTGLFQAPANIYLYENLLN